MAPSGLTLAAPQIGREPVGVDLAERFGVADRGEDLRGGQALGEGQEPVRAAGG
jgi:hypothetical protein